MRELDIKENQILGNYTTIGIGGPARYFVEVADADDLRCALEWASARALPALVLGGGSNMLVADSGWPGLVIKIGIRGIDTEDMPTGHRRIICGGGELWDDLVRFSVEAELQGIECLSGIPGTVGASPIQNIGAYGQEVKETIAWVEALERATGKVCRFVNADCGFAYRWSRFKGADRDRYVITRVAFDLQSGVAAAVRYGDLTRYFGERGIENPCLADLRSAVLAVRGTKGMVINATVPDSRSCGSFFMNPIVPIETARRVRQLLEREAVAGTEIRMPEFPAGEGLVKLSAAWLMERAGVQKGSALGCVGVSSLHVLALVNRGGGTAAELLQLVQQVQKTVHDRFGIELHPEPVFVGFESQPAAYSPSESQ